MYIAFFPYPHQYDEKHYIYLKANKNDIEDYIYENKDELEEYEIKSASNLIYKKSNSLEKDEIKQYLLKKGYKLENINRAMEEE